MTTEAQPTFLETVQEIAKDAVASLHGPVPAEVVTFDYTTQTADVKPVHKLSVDGELIDAGTLRDVVVCFPSGGTFSFTWHLSAGDFVELIPQDIDIGNWSAGTGSGSDPASMRRCSLSDLVAIPSIKRPTDPLGANRWTLGGSSWRDDKIRMTGDDDITLTSDDVRLGAYMVSDYAAIGSNIKDTMDTYCNAIQAAYSAYITAGGAAGSLANVDAMFSNISTATTNLQAGLPSWLSTKVRLV